MHAFYFFFPAFLLLERVLICVFWDKGASALSNTGEMALGWAWAPEALLRRQTHHTSLCHLLCFILHRSYLSLTVFLSTSLLPCPTSFPHSQWQFPGENQLGFKVGEDFDSHGKPLSLCIFGNGLYPQLPSLFPIKFTLKPDSCLLLLFEHQLGAVWGSSLEGNPASSL